MQMIVNLSTTFNTLIKKQLDNSGYKYQNSYGISAYPASTSTQRNGNITLKITYSLSFPCCHKWKKALH
jgi:hypothetical protein